MKKVLLGLVGLSCLAIGTVATATSGVGVGVVAQNVISNLGNVAKLITAASYVAGLAFVVGAIVKFKTHKENPTQIPIGTPIALLFVGAALIFIPSVFKTSGATLFGASGNVSNVSGLTSFGGNTTASH